MNVFRWGGLVVLVGLVGVMPAAAGPPTEQLRQYTDQVLKLLEDPNLQGPDRRAAVRNEAVDGDYATVRARVVTKQRGDIPVDARMIRRGDRWLIYDIAVENISLIANYRAQFDRIIRSASYQDLVTRLKTKREEFLQEARPGSS